jgi:hypothetical protein
LAFWEKAQSKPGWSHRKGRSPVWVRSWSVRVFFQGASVVAAGVVAPEGTLSRVGLLVPGEVFFQGASVVAAGVVAPEGTLSRVGPLMRGEVFFQGASVVAAGVVALEGTLSRVGPLVRGSARAWLDPFLRRKRNRSRGASTGRDALPCGSACAW